MIEIKKSNRADTRSADHIPTKDELVDVTMQHQLDVSRGIKFLIRELNRKGYLHDHTKLDYLDEFYEAFRNGTVKESDWYQKHIHEERHHLRRHVPDDVNLLDVIEHVVDCTMAGLSRSGEVYDLNIDPEVLVRAVSNTVELLKQNTKIVG